MASTYSAALRLELMATGDQSGTWGTTTNTNLGTLLEQAITGYLSVAQGDVANLTLTTTDGASDQARNAVIKVTGALTATRNVVVQTANKYYTIINGTTGGFSIVAKTAAGTGVSIPPGATINVFSDGTNVVMGQNYWNGQIGGAIYLDAGATVGPVYDLFRDSTSPAASDILGQLIFNGRDSAGNKQEYASIEATIIDATSTSEDSTLDMYTQVAGTRTKAISTGGGTTTYLYADAGAAVGPVIDLYRNSASPAASDIIGQVIFNGQDSGAAKQEYASIEAVVSDTTSGSEDGGLNFYATIDGTRRKLFSLNDTQALFGRPLPTLSNNVGDSTNDIDFASGAASDLSTTATGLIWVACAALTKQLDANWAVGTNQGMRYSGAAIANTTYHVWAVWTDAGVQDYYADPSAVQATVLGHLQAETGGSSYTHIRRIGSILRTGGAIKAFIQIGNYFVWKTPVEDVADAAYSGPATVTLASLPAGLTILGDVGIKVVRSTGIVDGVLRPTTSAAHGGAYSAGITVTGAASTDAKTNFGRQVCIIDTSRQATFEMNTTNNSPTYSIFSIGWWDDRGAT